MVTKLALSSLLWGALTCATACGGNAKPASPSVQSEAGAGGGAGAGSSAGAAGAVSAVACPNGDLPGPALAATCPASLPEPGSCCGRVGLSCSYPGDSTSHVAAVCIDDSVHALFWGQTAVLDQLACSSNAPVTPLAAGEPCTGRQAEPCMVHDLLTPQGLLNEQFATIVDGCGGLPDESSLEVEFDAGCATELSVQLHGATDASPLLGCVENALGVVRFSCADGLACARVERSTLR